MNKFYIKLPSANIDPKGALKSFLVNKMLSAKPWLRYAGIDTPRVERGIQYASADDYIVFDSSATFDVDWAKSSDLSESTKRYIPVYDLYTDFNSAINKLESYARAKCPFFSEPDYDFKYFGQPVKVFDNYVQIGLNIIPRKNTRAYLSALPGATIDSITEVIVKINNYKFA